MATNDAVAVVSGGSRGLGLALVSHLLSKGVSVATFARSETEATVQLADEHEGQFIFRTCDVKESAEVDAFVDDVEETIGAPTLLVNNAGIGQDHLISHLPDDRLSAILDINVFGAAALTRRIVQGLLIAGVPGRIVNITSICATHGFPGLSAYSGSKAALEAMTRALARELGPRGISVNAIAPGFFESEMSNVLDTRQIDTIRRRTPTGRLVTEEDLLPVLDLLVFGPTAITGQVLVVDGGFTA